MDSKPTEEEDELYDENYILDEELDLTSTPEPKYCRKD